MQEEYNQQNGVNNQAPIEDPANLPPNVINVPDPPQQYAQNQANAPKKRFGFKFTKKNILIVTGILLVVIGLSAFALYKNRTNNNSESSAPSSSSEEDKEKENSKSKYQLSNIQFSGNQEPYPYQPLFTDDSIKEHGFDDVNIFKEKFISFYKIGTLDNNEVLLFQMNFDEPGPPVISLLVKDGDSYTIFWKHSYDISNEHSPLLTPNLRDNVKIDYVSSLDKIIPEDSITYGGITASKTDPMYGDTLFFIDEEDMSSYNLQEISKIEKGTIYENVTESEHHKGIKQFSILLKLATGLYAPYRYATDILKDDNSASIDWNDGSKTTETYDWAMVRAGCGQVSTVNVLDKSSFGDLVEIGKAAGEPIYRLNSPEHQAFRTIYDNYNTGSTQKDAASAQEFYDNNGMIVVKNKLGYRVILVNKKYQPGGECGKPVIYLYPTKPTDISVKVGADVKVSIPSYDQGWNVTAYPDGTIVNKGEKYPYLFWEGTGHGMYPQITEGFIVKKSDIEKTLREHLTLLGLNDKESSDFLEFWLPLMPEKPYTRITWFGTRQMNELAPLTLSKKPDTLIRIFLDFEGLDRPIAIKPQRLGHVPRRGFVVVEWGGLRYVY